MKYLIRVVAGIVLIVVGIVLSSIFPTLSAVVYKTDFKKIRDLAIPLLPLAIPPLIGAIFAAIGLMRKYSTALKYAFSSWPAWLYLLLSATFTWIITIITQILGTRIINDGHVLLNHLLQSMFVAGFLLGILSKIPYGGDTEEQETISQIKTVHDYIYGIFDSHIERQIRQVVEERISNLIQDVNDIDSLLKEASRLIGGMRSKLNEGQIQRIKAEIDEYAEDKDFAAIIRVLMGYYNVDYIIRELAKGLKSQS